MTDWAAQWRARAAEIAAMAMTARDPVVKELLLELVLEYQKMEEQAAAPQSAESEAAD